MIAFLPEKLSVILSGIGNNNIASIIKKIISKVFKLRPPKFLYSLLYPLKYSVYKNG